MTKAEENYSRVKKYQDEHRKQGLCVQCPAPALAGKVRCAACLKRRAAIRKSRRHEAERLGMCYQCHTHKTLPKNRLCEDCYFKRTSVDHFGNHSHWLALKDLFYSQGCKCALSGVPMVLGENAELDHITPSSRAGSNDITNTQWVLCVVNRMKDHMLESEFFGLVESLYRTMKERNAPVH